MLSDERAAPLSPPVKPLSSIESCAYGLSLVLVLALGALNLNYPFVEDQVMALLGAENLAQGGTLYVDYWDNKMPWLFWFYRMAGALFGLDEFGVHALELSWMTVFALALMLGLRRYVVISWLSCFAPLAVIGVYYASADAFHLTQLEILVGLPLFALAWLVSQADLEGWQLPVAFALSGLLAGGIVTMKLVFAPLCVALWLVAAVHARWVAQRSWMDVIVRMLLPAAVGLLLVLAAVTLAFWLDGALDELYWTAFVYPPQALVAAPPASWLRLFESSGYFLSYFAVWSIFIVLAVAEWCYAERHLLTSLMMTWLVVGLAVILIQRFSWWPYHFLLLFPPAGILAVRGLGVLPRLVEARGGSNRALVLVLSIALAVPPVAALAVPAEQKLSAHLDVFVRNHAAADELHRYVNRAYDRIGSSVRFLAAETARPGPIYVFGNPLYYYLSGRTPAAPIAGWAWEYFLPSQWLALPAQLERSLPAYIYVDRKSAALMGVRDSSVSEFLNTAYAPFTNDHNGTWYQVRPELWRARHPAPTVLEHSP